jgi:hypothetical protein
VQTAGSGGSERLIYVLRAADSHDLVLGKENNGSRFADGPGFLLDAVMPGPHLVSSLLKRWTAGTLHHRVSRQQLPYYLDEFTFRFNRRTSRARGLLFYRLLQQSADTDPHPLSELIGGTGNDWDEPTDH